MKFILGTKEKMTEFFNDSGEVVPATLLSFGSVTVARVFESSKDGYDSVQVEFEGKKSRPKSGSRQRSGKNLKEFRLKSGEKIDLKAGDAVDLGSFAVGDKLEVSALSKGKGFQGVVKRHGFKGGPRSHGQKHSEREPGSIGGGLRTHVPKGMRMAGRMGGNRITQKNLSVVYLDKENNLMLVKGAIPGRKGTLVEIVSR